MGESLTVLQDLIEPARPGFWGTAENVTSYHIPCRVVRNGDVAKNGYVPRSQLPVRWFTPDELEKAQVKDGDIVLVSSGAYTGNAGIIAEPDDGLPVIASNFVRRLRPHANINSGWFFHLVRSYVVQKHVPAHTGGSAIPNLSSTLYRKCPIPFVPDDKLQRRIAKILSTVDEMIEQTEGLIAKYQQIKAGLMHDLFARGVTLDGRLRPTREQAPDLYKQSRLGWIPKEWEVKSCLEICEKITVGIVVRPTQYYVLEGIPAFRSANVRESGIDPSGLVFISRQANTLLAKSQLQAGDVISVRTGYPGTSAVVPTEFEGANCVDLLISRPSSRIRAEFLVSWINSSFGKDQVLRKQGGLAQQHFNVGELRNLLAVLPKMPEQNAIVERLTTMSRNIESEQTLVAKLHQQKHGLMHDLLTGRVRVKVAKSTSN